MSELDRQDLQNDIDQIEEEIEDLENCLEGATWNEKKRITNEIARLKVILNGLR